METELLSRNEFDKLIYKIVSAIHRFESGDIKLFSLNWAELHLMKFLAIQQEKTVSECAAELGMPVFKASRIVSRLEKRGFLRRGDFGHDRRTRAVSMTPSGLDQLETVDSYHFRLIMKNLNKCGEEESSRFISAISSLEDILIHPDQNLTSASEIKE